MVSRHSVTQLLPCLFNFLFESYNALFFKLASFAQNYKIHLGHIAVVHIIFYCINTQFVDPFYYRMVLSFQLLITITVLP
jgi:hypothetical protein